MKLAGVTIDRQRDRSKINSFIEHERTALFERDHSDFITFNYGYAHERTAAKEESPAGPTEFEMDEATQEIL